MLTTSWTGALLLSMALAAFALAMQVPAVRSWADGLWTEPFDSHP